MASGTIESEAATHAASRRPSWRMRLGVAAASLVAAALALELALRLVWPQPYRWLNVYADAPGLPYGLRAGAEQHDIGEGWSVFVDTDGYRARAVDDVLPPGEPFLLAVGDSFAFGHGVDYEDSFVARLEEHLGQRILNAAVPGYGPIEYLTVTRRHLDRPGLRGVLVFTFLGNDFKDCRERPERTVLHGALSSSMHPARYWVKANSHLYRFFSEHPIVRRDEADLTSEHLIFTPGAWGKPPLSDVLRIWAESFRDLAAACREAGVPLFVVVLPAYYDEHGMTNAHDIHGPIRIEVFDRLLEKGFSYGDESLPGKQAASVLEQLEIPFADVTDELERLGTSPYIPANGHYTPAANALVADWLAETLPAPFVP